MGGAEELGPVPSSETSETKLPFSLHCMSHMLIVYLLPLHSVDPSIILHSILTNHICLRLTEFSDAKMYKKAVRSVPSFTSSTPLYNPPLTMCSTYYLSLPKGTLFAFTINEEATLAHLNGQDVVEAHKSLSPKSRRLKKGVMYIGYVTKITPDNIELVILASEPNVAAPLFTSEYPSAAKHNTRQGVAVYTSRKALPSGVQRTRTKSRISAMEPSNLVPLPMMRSNCQHSLPPGLYTTLVSSESTFLRPSAVLPWPRAYAYRPTLKHSHMHRFVVHSFSAQGAKRPGVRLPKMEAERSEHIMDGLRAEEEEKWKETERSMCTFAQFNQLDINTSNGNSLKIANVSQPQQQATLTTYTDMDADDTLAHPYGLPICIDVFLDITKVKNLPSSPEDFEAQIEKIEELERLCRRKFAQRMEHWRASVDTNGWKGDEDITMPLQYVVE